MDDPDWVWPAWKFGMKRDDLFTTLHDQYNTFTYTLQDPEAFYHDVHEVSRTADSTEEFHRFMADRQRQRITELHESLESLAVEIIANPKLIGTHQWQHALQLFRTKSFDSIVRYFASYLPDDYLDRHGHGSVASSASSYSETDSVRTTSTKASSADDAVSLFSDDFFPHASVMTDEPCPIDYAEFPSSPDSASAYAQSSDASVYAPTMSTNPPSRSMSFSGSESVHLGVGFALRPSMRACGDDASQINGCDTTVTSIETRSSFDSADKVDASELPIHTVDDEEEEEEEGEASDDDIPTAQYPEDDFGNFDTHDTLDSDTPTPRQIHDSVRYLECEPGTPLVFPPSCHRALRRRSPSPRSYLVHRAERSHCHDVRRSPEEAACKIQKSLSDSCRKKPKARRWQE